MMTDEPGYMNLAYVESFASHGQPIRLARTQGWLLRRAIPGAESLFDAMGCYPLFCLKDWTRLANDLDDLAPTLVSLVLVSDPLASVDANMLSTCFDKVQPHKPHYVVECDQPPSSFVNRSHQRHALRALRDVQVDRCERPLDWLEDWMRLYGVLARRHSITGLRLFDRQAMARQLTIPGMEMFRSSVNGRTVGLDLWFVQDDKAHGHLAAFDEEGHSLHAAYASKWRVLEYFHGRVNCVNLGAGRLSDASDGLSYFKRGFSTATRPAWLCGRIFQPDVYAELVGRKDAPEPAFKDYFPAYRAGELA